MQAVNSAQTSRNSSQYVSAVNAVKQVLKASFAERPAGPGPCRWRELSVYSTCIKIAEQFQVPLWDVVADANPAF